MIITLLLTVGVSFVIFYGLRKNRHWTWYIIILFSLLMSVMLIISLIFFSYSFTGPEYHVKAGLVIVLMPIGGHTVPNIIYVVSIKTIF